MQVNRAHHRLWTGNLFPFVVLVGLQTTTPDPDVGPAELASYLPSFVRLGWFLVAFLAVVLLSRVLVEPALTSLVRQRNLNNPTLGDAIIQYFRVGVLVTAVLVGIGVAGYGRFFAGSALIIGAATLAVGVAGQQVLGSFVSGTALVFDPEFNVGNYIEWSDGEGTVESISLRVTRVETPDGELVTIPNTVLAGQAISRPFGRDRYRVVERIDLTPEGDVGEAIQQLGETARDLDGVADEPAPDVFVDELEDDVLVLRVHYWIRNPRQRDIHTVRSEYVRALRRRLTAARITVRSVSGA